MNARAIGLRWSMAVVGWAWLAVFAAPGWAGEAVHQDAAASARAILAESGVEGGLVVHLGCGDGRLTAALRENEGFLVHGLERDEAAVAEARRHVASLGFYGPVAIDRLRGSRLPYTDNLVNLLVIETLDGVAAGEIERVLAPEGVAMVRQADGWRKTVKPRPEEIGRWTHYLHGPDNNAVTEDVVVGPPYHLQWVGDPTWARSHEHLASISAVVTCGRRLFYAADEGPTAFVALEADWKLVARDAFSGVVLWRRPLGTWEGHLRGFRSGPAELPRRLVASADRLFVALGYGEPLSALCPASGETLGVYEETRGTLEVVHQDGVLYVVTGRIEDESEAAAARRRGAVPPARHRRLVVLEAESGKVVWEKADAETAELMPLTLAVADGRLYFQNPRAVVCLDAATGKPRWQTDRPISVRRPAWSSPTLVVHDGVVISADRQATPTVAEAETDAVSWIVSAAGGQAPEGEMIAFAADSGERLWNAPCREAYNAPVDVLVVDGLVWSGYLVQAKEPGITVARDVRTGEVVRRRPADQEFFRVGMGHHRCYRNKATSRYLVLGRSGIELIDVASGVGIADDWVRGACQYGVMPANGLLYAPSHSCACFIEAKLNGFNALAPRRAPRAEPDDPPAEARLEPGPAYERPFPSPARKGAGGEGQAAGGFATEPSRRQESPPTGADRQQESPPTDWPTYRQNVGRSGATPAAVPAALEQAWQTELGGRLTSVVVAEGKLWVAQIDAHTLHALDAADGRKLWSYTAGGRIDSPPTVWQGRVLFGSADGWVYCLRADDGRLAWRFRAAPEERRIVAYDQIESVWPVPGNVLVHDGVAFAAAGRSSLIDGGMRLVRLHARSGELLSETRLDQRDPATGRPPIEIIRGTDMPGYLPDVLSTDGESVFMRHARFDLSGSVVPERVPHLFSPAGFLDDAWWHRTYWIYGAKMGIGWGGWPNAGNQVAAGRLLVHDGETIFGFGRTVYARHGSHVGLVQPYLDETWPLNESRATHYRLYAAPLGAKPDGEPWAARLARRGAPPEEPSEPGWACELPLMVRAMVLAGEVLFLAGPPDPFTTDDPTAAWEGRRGGLLRAVAAGDGRTLAESKLEAPPAFDGMAAADGRLYLATLDGRVLCMGAARK
jgi:outer membrane protein assembly factor BamB